MLVQASIAYLFSCNSTDWLVRLELQRTEAHVTSLVAEVAFSFDCLALFLAKSVQSRSAMMWAGPKSGSYAYFDKKS
jgi:hypothetical protein